MQDRRAITALVVANAAVYAACFALTHLRAGSPSTKEDRPRLGAAAVRDVPPRPIPRPVTGARPEGAAFAEIPPEMLSLFGGLGGFDDEGFDLAPSVAQELQLNEQEVRDVSVLAAELHARAVAHTRLNTVRSTLPSGRSVWWVPTLRSFRANEENTLVENLRGAVGPRLARIVGEILWERVAPMTKLRTTRSLDRVWIDASPATEDESGPEFGVLTQANDETVLGRMRDVFMKKVLPDILPPEVVGG